MISNPRELSNTIKRENKTLHTKLFHSFELIGESSNIQEIKDQILKLSTSESRIFDFEPSSEFTSLDPQFHANLAIHYNYSELMSAFVKINNITNSKKDIWEGYREIGINALFGLSYSY